MKASEYEEMMREDEALELMREKQEEDYIEWKNNNIKELLNDFIDDNKKEFADFLNENIVDETYDMDYYIEIFCKEENEDDFYYFCKDRYGSEENHRSS